MLFHSLVIAAAFLPRPDPKEQFVRRCRRITQEIDESCMDVEHQFLTEEDMEQKGYSQFLILRMCFTRICPRVICLLLTSPQRVRLSTVIHAQCCCYQDEN